MVYDKDRLSLEQQWENDQKRYRDMLGTIVVLGGKDGQFLLRIFFTFLRLGNWERVREYFNIDREALQPTIASLRQLTATNVDELLNNFEERVELQVMIQKVYGGIE